MRCPYAILHHDVGGGFPPACGGRAEPGPRHVRRRRGTELRGGRAGAGTLGVDDASLEVVDPAKVPATEGATVQPLDPAKRARKLKESLPSTPDRPENLDFERQAAGPAAGAGGRAGEGRPDRVPYQRAQACWRTESNATPGSGMARHGTA